MTVDLQALNNYMLHLDTSGPDGFVALSDGAELLAHERLTDPKNYAATLHPTMAAMLDGRGLTMAELSAVSVVGGPGSYTGLRIALATAKGICYAVDKPLLMANYLHLLAWPWVEVADASYESCIAIIPARVGEYFIAAYAAADGHEVLEPQHVDTDEALRFIQAASTYDILIVGQVAPDLSMLREIATITWVEERTIMPKSLCEIAFSDLKANRNVNLAHAEPFYLKAPFTHNK
jgi:tRNA threonylcarbamoyladenosine biosynthesis protein TsaB